MSQKQQVYFRLRYTVQVIFGEAFLTASVTKTHFLFSYTAHCYVCPPVLVQLQAVYHDIANSPLRTKLEQHHYFCTIPYYLPHFSVKAIYKNSPRLPTFCTIYIKCENKLKVYFCETSSRCFFHVELSTRHVLVASREEQEGHLLAFPLLLLHAFRIHMT